MPRKNEIDYLSEISSALGSTEGSSITQNIVTSPALAASTSTNVLPARSTRQFLIIQNISDTNMYVNFGAAASTSTLLLPANGGGVSFEGAYVPLSTVNLFCTSASKPYYILEAYSS